jgi:hypothetical protein
MAIMPSPPKVIAPKLRTETLSPLFPSNRRSITSAPALVVDFLGPHHASCNRAGQGNKTHAARFPHTHCYVNFDSRLVMFGNDYCNG